MELNKEEMGVMKTFTDEQVALIVKFFIRPFEGLPTEYAGTPNERLGEQVKAHLIARDLNLNYLNQFKVKRNVKDSEENAPIAPD